MKTFGSSGLNVDVQKLRKLWESIQRCRRCRNFNVIKPQPSFPRTCKIMIIGQNPSPRWTRNRQIWAGLDRLPRFEEEIKPILKEAYITNVVKCVGKASMKKARVCGEWLKQEIEILRPRRIIGVGKLACDWLDIEDYEAFTLRYHPSYVLRFRRKEVSTYVRRLKRLLQV